MVNTAASVLQAVKQLEGIKTEGVLQIPPQENRSENQAQGSRLTFPKHSGSQDVSRCLKFPNAVFVASHCVSTLREGKDVVEEVVEGEVATSSVLTAGLISAPGPTSATSATSPPGSGPASLQ